MSEPVLTLPASTEPPPPRKPSRLRRFFLRHLPLTVVSAVVLLAVAVAGLFFWASSGGGENFVRRRLVHELEAATGGRVEIASFHWNLLALEAEAGGVIIHGLEAPGEAPCAQIEHLRLRVSLLNFWSPRILLRDLEVSKPALHLIVYPDGATNLPQPRKPRKPGKPAIKRLFDAKVGRIVVEQGILHYENRAAAFDFQNRFLPLDFDASDVALRMSYVPAALANPESYRIEAGATNLNLSRGLPKDGSKRASKAEPRPVEGYFQATLDLMRTAAYLRSLRITARSRGLKDRTLEVSGEVDDFAHPRWQGRAAGELDMKLLDPITGYPFAPEGIAHLDLDGTGQAGQFRIDGGVHIDGGSYIGTGVVETGIRLDARVHADPDQLLITSIIARLRQGGQIEGIVALDHWLPPASAELRPASSPAGNARNGKVQPTAPVAPPSADDITIPVNGKVTANFKNVSLDTIMDMVGRGPFQRMGLDALVNGPAVATWIDGDNRTLAVNALLTLNPSAHSVAGEAPTSGLIDATYTQRDGAVDLRNLDLHLPSSRIEAHGHLGAYPLSSSTKIDVDLHTGNLNEFDAVLRDLGLSRNGKTGTAALPVTLAGQAEFHGAWSGSLIDPHLAGAANATQLSIEIPSILKNAQPSQPQYLRWDSAEAAGSYSSARIAIDRGLLRRGKTEIALDGSLTAALEGPASSHAPTPTFDANSLLHLRLRAGKLGMDDLQPLTGPNLPVTGTLDAQLQADGPIHALNGLGWAELAGGSVYGEPVKNIRAQATIANQVLQLTAVTVNHASGNLTATGSYDFNSRRFQLDAEAAGLDVARIEWLRKQDLDATGKLGISITGSGTLDDPRLEVNASLNDLAFGGEPLGSLELVAHTANRAVTYDVTSRLKSTELVMHGQTALSGDYATQAKLDFSGFNIDALLKLAHVQGLNGESALAGTIDVAGPLAKLEDMRGEARLQKLEVTVSGVHLKSEGGIHATLANARINLDPLRITGEQTDLHTQGSLGLKGDRQLDFAASGAINLKVAETFDPDLTASGATTFQVEAHGPLRNPGWKGRIDFQDGSLALEDLPNGLSQIHGALEFNQNRLEVKSLTAMTGGGLLSVDGYLSWQNGLYANLTAKGDNIRIRYPEGVSSLADATLRLQGSRNNLLLSGDVLITRFAVSPDLDIAALTAQANAVQTIAPPDAPSNHIRLDVHIASSSQLNFQNSYAKLAGDVDLHLRGTVASPSLLGRVSITEGSALIAGTRYELQRGEISFTNPVRIEPDIDLNATAHVEDYDITLSLRGTPQKLAVTYRSDPPLPEADVVALLALGRTQNQQRLYTQQQEQSGANPTTDALLGGALNASVSSRVQKLFGAGSVKVDPNYLGALGNSTSRIIAEEQLGSNVTLTYATNVNTTAQQLIQAEVAINHHVSLLVARDESGVFSMVLKTTRRYR
jgi:translocation and assembly module TamB